MRFSVAITSRIFKTSHVLAGGVQSVNLSVRLTALPFCYEFKE